MILRNTESATGLITINVPEELDATCIAAHNRFLVKHGYAGWKCILTMLPNDITKLQVESFAPPNESGGADTIHIDLAHLALLDSPVDFDLAAAIMDVMERHHAKVKPG
jgi:hypothetical protein